jgi:2-polyprenyl-3-methyl-5-hydroxy-6-metoxy-1,4-benzoquinol methylase
MPDTEQFSNFPCDVCGSNDAVEIDVARGYTNNQPLHVCKACGFVYVRARRSAERIAQAWSKEIYQHAYTAHVPAVKARQTFVADFLDSTTGLKGKSLCDIGGGEGQFLCIARDQYGANVFCIEPSPVNGKALAAQGIEHFVGTIEDYAAARLPRKFDVVTIMWTLENCQSCKAMLEAANHIVKEGGLICVATGSRILVPFKKPLNYYLSDNAADTHAFRFSANSLRNLLAGAGFSFHAVNRYIDNDILCMVAKKNPQASQEELHRDDWRKIVDFFCRWDKETRDHYWNGEEVDTRVVPEAGQKAI